MPVMYAKWQRTYLKRKKKHGYSDKVHGCTPAQKQEMFEVNTCKYWRTKRDRHNWRYRDTKPHHEVQVTLGPTQLPIKWAPEAPSLGVKRPGR